MDILTALCDALARLYYLPADAAALVIMAGLNPAYVRFDGRALTIWSSILTEAENRQLMAPLLEQAQAQHADDVKLAAAIGGYTAWMAAQQGEA